MDLSDKVLEYPFGQQLPAGGEMFAVAPGIQWLRMPLPFALDHINLWLLADGEDWCAIDCGVDTAPTRAAWEQIFATPTAPRLRRVLATHCHPDHVGLATWLCARFACPLWMSCSEYLLARLMSANSPGTENQSAIAHFSRHGMSAELGQQMQARKNHYPSLVPSVPSTYTRLSDGQEIQIGNNHWCVISGAGHAPEHVSLYSEKLGILISGDMILPRISTNVSVFALEPEANPLQLYLESLQKFDKLPADTLVLPSHGKPFRGLHTRLAQLREHHRLRLAEVEQACVNAKSAADIVPIMFQRALDVHQLGFAMGEALAHLHKLWYDGVLARETGTDLIIRFRSA